MKAATCLVLALACAGIFEVDAGRVKARTTPVQEVIELMEGMLTKGKKEKHEEEVQFAAYKQFCTSATEKKTNEVHAATEHMGLLEADIQQAEQNAVDDGLKVQQLHADIATWNGDEKAATGAREIERAEYMKVHKEYTDTIDAVNRAYQVLQAKAHNVPQAPAQAEPAISLVLGRKGLNKVPEARRVLAAFLASAAEEEGDAESPPEANAYESRSSGVLEILMQLKDKFVEERSALEKEEMNKRHAYELLLQDLKKSVATAEDSISSKAQRKAQSLQSAATMKADLQDTTTTRTDDQKILATTTATCTQKEADFQERQRLRAEEISAIEQALEILSGDKVSGTSSKYFGTSFVQGRRAGAPALLQLRTAGQSPAQERAVEYLSTKAEIINSRLLSALATRVHDDPFEKVKKMIQDLIVRLQEEATEEAQHKGWCDTELASNEQVRTARSSDVERLSSEIDGLKSSIAELSSEITDANVQLSESDMDVATQTELRNKEKAENEQTVKDAQEAQAAIGQAVTVLEEFYRVNSETPALVQARRGAAVTATSSHRQAPPIFDGQYKGMGGSSGVISMLEVIQSDYARLESTTSAIEATAHEEFNKQMADAAVFKAQLQKDVEHKTNQRQSQEGFLSDRNNDLTSAQKELEAASNYFEQLKPSCLDAGVSFQEREQRRQEEIQSLQEALRILNGEDLA